MKNILTALVATLALLSVASPAQAKDIKPLRGEYILCNKDKVQVFEDGTASCSDNKPMQVGKRYNYALIGTYIRCQKWQNVKITTHDKTTKWATCNEKFPPCENEDGSGSSTPCLWDAKAQGNHRGASFVLARNEVTYYLANAHIAPKDRDKIWFYCKSGYKAKSSSADGYPSVRCTKVK